MIVNGVKVSNDVSKHWRSITARGIVPGDDDGDKWIFVEYENEMIQKNLVFRCHGSGGLQNGKKNLRSKIGFLLLPSFSGLQSSMILPIHIIILYLPLEVSSGYSYEERYRVCRARYHISSIAKTLGIEHEYYCFENTFTKFLNSTGILDSIERINKLTNFNYFPTLQARSSSLQKQVESPSSPSSLPLISSTMTHTLRNEILSKQRSQRSKRRSHSLFKKSRSHSITDNLSRSNTIKSISISPSQHSRILRKSTSQNALMNHRFSLCSFSDDQMIGDIERIQRAGLFSFSSDQVIFESNLMKEGSGVISFSLKKRWHILSMGPSQNFDELVMTYFSVKIDNPNDEKKKTIRFKEKGSYIISKSTTIVGRGIPQNDQKNDSKKKKKNKIKKAALFIGGLRKKNRKRLIDVCIDPKDIYRSFYIKTEKRTYFLQSDDYRDTDLWLDVIEKIIGCKRIDMFEGSKEIIFAEEERRYQNLIKQGSSSLYQEEEEEEEEEEEGEFVEDIQNLKIPFSSLELMEEIGSGGGGAIVYLSKWKKNDNDDENSIEEVAVKLFKKIALAQDKEGIGSLFGDFEKEIKLMLNISKLQYPFILPCYGYCLEENKCGIVMEYCLHGHLGEAIFEKIISSPKEKIRIAHEIAQGIHFLHERDIMHRDIKINNVLVNYKKTAKVMDFGWSKQMIFDNNNSNTGDDLGSIQSIQQLQQKFKNKEKFGTNQYLSPELAKGLDYDYKVDVYSFGLVLFVLISEQLFPFGRNLEYDIEDKIANDPTHRPQLTKEKEEEWNGKRSENSWFIGLMKKCWDYDPEKRPSFKDILSEFTMKFEKRFYVL